MRGLVNQRICVSSALPVAVAVKCRMLTASFGNSNCPSAFISTGSTPAACVAQKNSNPVYATNQCDALKGKNLALLWGGVALSGVGAVLMIRGSRTSADLTPNSIGLFHHFSF